MLYKYIILKATAKNPKNRYDDARQMHEDLLTALDDDRMNEPPYKYPYPEHDTESTKNLKKIKDIENNDSEDSEEQPIATNNGKNSTTLQGERFQP